MDKNKKNIIKKKIGDIAGSVSSAVSSVPKTLSSLSSKVGDIAAAPGLKASNTIVSAINKYRGITPSTASTTPEFKPATQPELSAGKTLTPSEITNRENLRRKRNNLPPVK